VTARAGLTYLRVLVYDVQSVLGRPGGPGRPRGKPPAPDAQLEALEHTSERFYAAVLRGVTVPEIAPDESTPIDEQRRRAFERNRRSAFARTAKSTLAAYARHGGDIRALDPETVTRDPLNASVRQMTGRSEAAYQIDRHRNAIIRLATRHARDDVEAARQELTGAIAALSEALAAIDGVTTDERPDLTPAERQTITSILAGRPAHLRMAGART
jgi:hypothetical protein